MSELLIGYLAGLLTLPILLGLWVLFILADDYFNLGILS